MTTSCERSRRCVQVAPPLVDLKRPTPASESAEPFGSPVPTYNVLPLESLGSIAIDPIALEVNPSEEEGQVGEAASPLLLSQMPPPAAPTQTRQLVALQSGATARAETRPELMTPAPAPG